tara:strand:+ start:1015 stop:1314 length:300 start_codon:yes stop_codon:yes gene_type:complete
MIEQVHFTVPNHMLGHDELCDCIRSVLSIRPLEIQIAVSANSGMRIACTLEQFGRFMIERSQLDVVNINSFKELHAVIIQTKPEFVIDVTRRHRNYCTS